MSTLKQLNHIADAYDSGYIDGGKEAYRKLTETRKRLEALISRAVVRGEFETLVIVRQILRGLK